MKTPVLSIRSLSKKFGGLAVTQSVDLDLAPGARVGLIGPNGAGKTTFVNLLTGFLTPDSGTVVLEGRPIEGMKMERRVHLGLARTHQINTLLMENSALENVALAVAERTGVSWRMMNYARQWRACLDEAQSYLDQVRIGSAGDGPVRELAYGVQRMLEIAIALALRPKVLLLDEPAAGVPGADTHLIHEALAALPQDIAILVIEHDMELIFRFAREIVVLVQGRVQSRGTPAQIAADPEVRAVYLGKSVA